MRLSPYEADSKMSASIPVVAFTPYSELRAETVLIGANCTDTFSGQVPRITSPRIISPYAGYAEIARSADYCWEVALELCRNLGERLNGLLRLDRSPAYWEPLILPWMVAWVENLYDRYLRLCWIRENMPDALLELPRTVPPMPLYRKSIDVWGRSHLHLTNVWLYSLLIEQMGLGGRVRLLDKVLEDQEDAGYSDGGVDLATYFKNYARLLLRPTPFRQAGIDWLEIGSDSIKDSRFSVEALDRGCLRLDLTDDEFKAIIGNMMPRALPAALVEEYRARSSYARCLRQERKIRKLCISNSFWSNDTLKYLLAEMRDSGDGVAGRQHGGGYGWYAFSTAERIERRLSDFFITWGWTDNGHCRTLALPDARLSGLADTHKPVNEDILFVGTHGPMYMFRYQSYWIPEFVYSRYGPMQGIFLGMLNKPLSARVIYRPCLREYGWHEQERIRRFFPAARFDSSARAVQSMKRCSLVVIDHPGTTLIEALAMNAPTVAYWDATQCPMRIDAQPYFERLKRAGIVHESPEEAAKHVNGVAADPQGWWRSPAVQSARAEFCRRFAWADRNWKALWREALNKH